MAPWAQVCGAAATRVSLNGVALEQADVPGPLCRHHTAVDGTGRPSPTGALAHQECGLTKGTWQPHGFTVIAGEKRRHFSR
jgi:hypothetical protein